MPIPGLIVRFVHCFPREDVVYLAHRRARERSLMGPLLLVVDGKHAADSGEHAVRIETASGMRVLGAAGLDVLEAVRGVFDHLALAAVG